jgi:Ni,Fe-hydrogenase III small subunit
VDCGGCNGCEIEIFATLSPLFDAERFGIKVVPSRVMRISCCLPAR